MKIFSTISILAIFLICGCVGPYAPPPDDPPEVVDSHPGQTAALATVDYSQRLAAVFEGVAEQLEAGRIITAAEANQKLAVGNKAAREAAFAPVNEAVQKQIGDERWNAAAAAKLFRQIAQGHRKVKL